MTKICDFPLTLYDLTKYYDRCGWYSSLKYKLLKAFVDGLNDNDEEALSPKINMFNLRT